MERLVFIFLFSILGLTTGLSQNFKPSLSNAQEAYRDGNFAEAITAYEEILGKGFHSPTIYYNLGNAYFRSDQLGKSLLNFERALLLAPHDRDIKHNIRVATQQIKEQPEPVAGFFLERWWSSWRQGLSATTWAGIGLTLLWVAVFGLIVWILGRTRQWKKIGFITGIVLLLLSSIPLLLAFSRAGYEKETGYAILLKQESYLFSAPDAASQKGLQVYEGLKVQLLDKIENWYKVRLVNGEIGWLEESMLEEI